MVNYTGTVPYRLSELLFLIQWKNQIQKTLITEKPKVYKSTKNYFVQFLFTTVNK